MSTLAKSFLHSFNALPNQDRQEVALLILRQLQSEDYGELTDAELCAIAEETLLAIDREDATRGDQV